LHEAKLETLRGQVLAMGGKLGAAYSVDWSSGTGQVPKDYDRVLVDAPCSGTGTMRRRPDLLTRDLKKSLPSLQTLQAAILASAATRCRLGGNVVYAVCSVLREEAELVIDRVLEACRWLEPAAFEAPELRALAGDGSTLRVLPHVHGTDGYFIANLRRVK
jgi:16S rRNA (cytosine967-C5)-methyltransferase